jgi:uncharacterized lipoprotein YddW (UPF0748 family)
MRHLLPPLLLLAVIARAAVPAVGGEGPRAGLFVRDDAYFGSVAEIERLLDYCAVTDIDTLFVRLYSSDQCFFHTDRYNSRSFHKRERAAGIDVLQYLIERAGEQGVDVVAWVITYGFPPSVLDRHLLVAEYGKSVLTRDQYGRYYDGSKTGDDRDTYYMRDTLCWLEPGDPRVTAYLRGMVDELTSHYPALAGVLFDFVRYPSDIPFVPGSRYSRWGYSPGYGEESLKRFEKEYGYSPTLDNVAKEYDGSRKGMFRALAWDRWRREQITGFLADMKDLLNPRGMILTCAVFAYADRLYFHGFQDWRGWIERGIVDYVVLMNYSVDDEMVYLISKQHVTTYPERVWICLGAYLFGGNSGGFHAQMGRVLSVDPAGIAFFSYDEMREWPHTIMRE